MRKIKKNLLIFPILNLFGVLVLLIVYSGVLYLSLLMFLIVWNILLLFSVIKFNIDIIRAFEIIKKIGDFLNISVFLKEERYTFKELSYGLENILSVLRELKKKEEEDKRVFETLMQNVSSGILIFNDNKVIFANRYFHNIFKFKNIEGNDISHIFLPQYRQIFTCIEKARKYYNKTKCNTTFDSRTMTVEIIPVEGKSPLFVMILTDTTLENSLAKIKKELIENLSHEFRTPLTIIKGYAEAVEEEVKNKEFIGKIKASIDEIEDIIHNLTLLLYTEKEQNTTVQPLNIEELCAKLKDKFEKPSRDKGLNLVIKNKLKTCKNPHLDSMAVWLIVSNLLDNAIKFTENGTVELCIYDEEPYVVFEVSDTGMGIEETHINRIFERFYRTPEARMKKGHGLGLAIVKHLVVMNKGQINVQSQKNRGTTFFVKLPCKP